MNGRDEGVEKALKKPLFYTDLKVPDLFSIWPGILFSPAILHPDGTKTELRKSLVTNCPAGTSHEQHDAAMGGVFCPTGTYKERRKMEKLYQGDYLSRVLRREAHAHLRTFVAAPRSECVGVLQKNIGRMRVFVESRVILMIHT